jgi:hypothetical protein
MDESLKMLAESADSRFLALAQAARPGGLLPVVLLGYGVFANSGRAEL